MLRFFFLLLTVMLSLLSVLLAYWFVRKLYRWSYRLLDSGRDYMVRRKQEREWRQNKKQLPEFVRRGVEHLETARSFYQKMPGEWRVLLAPAFADAGRIVDVVINSDTQAREIRNFFTVTLDAFEDFVRALHDGHSIMKGEDREKALQGIRVFSTDFQHYLETVNEKRRFNFHVLTEVIRQRLRK